MKGDVAGLIRSSYNLDTESYGILIDSIENRSGLYHRNPVIRYIQKYVDDRKSVKSVKAVLKRNKLPANEHTKILSLVINDIKLNRRIERLDTMQNLFKYWHVAHLPFAMVMLIIMLIHVGVTLLFGYRWVF